jgi:hypothetical protein
VREKRLWESPRENMRSPRNADSQESLQHPTKERERWREMDEEKKI